MIVSCAEPDTAQSRLGLVKDNMKRADYGAASLELANLIQAHPEHREARLLQGKVSLAAGRAAAAEAQLNYARELGTTGRDIYRPLAEAILAQGQPERIKEALGEVPGEAEDKVAWLIAQGMAALHLKEAGAAEAFFAQVVRIDSENLDAQLGLAAVKRARGDLAAAHVKIHNVTRSHPLSIAAWQALGSLRYEQGRLVDAERAFVNAIEGTDGLDRAYEYMLARVGLIETQWHLDKNSLAIQNTKELMDSYPWHPLPKYVRGLLAFLANDYETAGDYLYRVVAVLPDHKPSLKLLAAINSTQGRLGRAQLYLDKYFALNENEPEMLALLAETYLQMGNADEAVLTLKPLITNATQNATYLDLYGTACRHARSCDDGQNYLARAVEAEPGNLRRQTRLAAAYLNQRDIASADALMSTWNPPGTITEESRQLLRLERFLRSGQEDRAVEYAKKLRRENPSNLHALLALAEIARNQGETDEESAWLDLARERNPTAVEPRLIMANRHILKRRYPEAVKVAQEAAAAHPYNASVLRVLAHALINIKQYDEALSTAAEAHRLAPSQRYNSIALLHAYMMQRDTTKISAMIAEILQEDPGATNIFGPLLVEIQLAGNREIAKDGLELIRSLGGEADVVAEIEGDLFMLDSRKELARRAYEKANSIRRTEMRTMKAKLVK
ncbi:MAG: tetratricopeptide repeat protein [Gammaproteobacteria bacterium]